MKYLKLFDQNYQNYFDQIQGYLTDPPKYRSLFTFARKALIEYIKFVNNVNSTRNEIIALQDIIHILIYEDLDFVEKENMPITNFLRLDYIFIDVYNYLFEKYELKEMIFDNSFGILLYLLLNELSIYSKLIRNKKAMFALFLAAQLKKELDYYFPSDKLEKLSEIKANENVFEELEKLLNSKEEKKKTKRKKETEQEIDKLDIKGFNPSPLPPEISEKLKSLYEREPEELSKSGKELDEVLRKISLELKNSFFAFNKFVQRIEEEKRKNFSRKEELKKREDLFKILNKFLFDMKSELKLDYSYAIKSPLMFEDIIDIAEGNYMNLEMDYDSAINVNLLIDCSGSMTEKKVLMAKDVIRYLFDQRNVTVKNIYLFNVDIVDSVDPKEYLEEKYYVSNAGTNISKSLFNYWQKEDKPVVIITDCEDDPSSEYIRSLSNKQINKTFFLFIIEKDFQYDYINNWKQAIPSIRIVGEVLNK